MLNADDLMEDAARQAGLTEYGDFPLSEGLGVLCRALNREARLNARGLTAVRNEIGNTLVQRLRIEDFFRRHPETIQQEIAAPVMVTGLPRGGTTALSQMLSRDPGLRSIRRWEAEWPSPPPSPETDRDDGRMFEMQRKLAKQLELTPEYRTQLQVDANDPTEHYCYLRLTFQSPHFAGFFNVPSYGEWALAAPMTPSYRYVRRTLQFLQARYPTRRWNLKYPQDLYNLPALTEVFPDAILIWNHRDPAKTVPSVASLIVTLRRSFTDHIDREDIGRLELQRCRLLVERGMEYRARADAKPFFDTYNRDLVRDAAATIRDLYARIGLEYTDAFDAELQARNRTLPKGKYGAHVYSAEDFGLSDAALDKAFDFYTSRFGLKEDAVAAR